MGVIYKLRDEVVQFIVSQRQSNPLFSCRQLAESASQKFGLQLSKSSVHDVLKESGIVTPRGRKPKDKFEIPQEKKKQIQAGLSQVKLLPSPAEVEHSQPVPVAISPVPQDNNLQPPVILSPRLNHSEVNCAKDPSTSKDSLANDKEISPEYEGAGRIFYKAALWDLGIFSEEGIKDTDWKYYLTYSKGIKVDLENNKSFFIDLPLPIERCIREAADGLISNVRPLIVYKVSEEELFKLCMKAQAGFKIQRISIVDRKDHTIFDIDNIVEHERMFKSENMIFVENNDNNILARSKAIFFHGLDVDDIEYIYSIKGFDVVNKNEVVVTLLIDDGCDFKDFIKEAAVKLSGMHLRDEQDRLVKVELRGNV